MKISTIELFAGAGGLALGLEKANFNHLFLNEKDSTCCTTLSSNRPSWKVIHEDIHKINFLVKNSKCYSAFNFQSSF